MEYKELTPEQFRKMQLVELDILKEFDRVCRKNNINYVMIAGTMLGAIRHKGFIPWDDDIDVAMLREDYEKFKKTCLDDLNSDICYFQDHTTDPEYRWGHAKLRRTGTTFVRVGQEHLKCKTGIFIDVFAMDDVPKTIPMPLVQDFRCFCLRKILWSEVGRVNTKGFWKVWLTLLSKIPVEWVFKRLNHYAKKSKNSSSNGVRLLTFPASGNRYNKHPLKERYGLPKKWFLERAEYEFEGYKFYGPKDYDGFLSFVFNDYMKLPPEEKREQHSPFSSITFPDSKDDNSK